MPPRRPQSALPFWLQKDLEAASDAKLREIVAQQGAADSSEQQNITVSQLTQLIRGTFSADAVLGQAVKVCGQLSNVKQASSGHIYATLRDEGASINLTMWASSAKKLKFELENGLEIIATGKLEVYAPNGSYSLVATKAEPVGVGELQLAFEQLHAKLEAEGWFDSERKKPLPGYITRLGIVTSPTGAVIEDMLRVIRHKNPKLHVVLAPTAVQGDKAAAQIAAAIVQLQAPELGIEAIIVARGGGSAEDLFCFSQAEVVRAIGQSRLPVITGIGHQPDYGLADLAADYSAQTPTAAADTIVPDWFALAQEWQLRKEALIRLFYGVVIRHEERLGQSKQTMVTAMRGLLRHQRLVLGHKAHTMQQLVAQGVQRAQAQVQKQVATLHALSPLASLARGYAVVQTQGGKVLISSNSIKKGDAIEITLAQGGLSATVTSVSDQTTTGETR